MPISFRILCFVNSSIQLVKRVIRCLLTGWKSKQSPGNQIYTSKDTSVALEQLSFTILWIHRIRVYIEYTEVWKRDFHNYLTKSIPITNKRIKLYLRKEPQIKNCCSGKSTCSPYWILIRLQLDICSNKTAANLPWCKSLNMHSPLHFSFVEIP